MSVSSFDANLRRAINSSSLLPDVVQPFRGDVREKSAPSSCVKRKSNAVVRQCVGVFTSQLERFLDELNTVAVDIRDLIDSIDHVTEKFRDEMPSGGGDNPLAVEPFLDDVAANRTQGVASDASSDVNAMTSQESVKCFSTSRSRNGVGRNRSLSTDGKVSRVDVRDKNNNNCGSENKNLTRSVVQEIGKQTLIDGDNRDWIFEKIRVSGALSLAPSIVSEQDVEKNCRSADKLRLNHNCSSLATTMMQWSRRNRPEVHGTASGMSPEIGSGDTPTTSESDNSNYDGFYERDLDEILEKTTVNRRRKPIINDHNTTYSTVNRNRILPSVDYQSGGASSDDDTSAEGWSDPEIDNDVMNVYDASAPAWNELGRQRYPDDSSGKIGRRSGSPSPLSGSPLRGVYAVADSADCNGPFSFNRLNRMFAVRRLGWRPTLRAIEP